MHVGLAAGVLWPFILFGAPALVGVALAGNASEKE
jgi:hypothetical protein